MVFLYLLWLDFKVYRVRSVDTLRHSDAFDDDIFNILIMEKVI